MKNFLIFIIFTFCFFSSECTTLKITCRAKGMELVLLKEAIDAWIKKTGNMHSVEIITLPHASNECFALYKQWLSAESFDVDILLMDVAWIGVLSNYLADLSEFYKPDEIDVKDYFNAIKDSMYCNNKMVALPLYIDCGIIYYRKDLLNKYGKPVPTTWQDLYATAEYIQNEERKNPEKKNKFYGFVFQAKAFEMLTCIFTETVDSFGGAIIVDGKAVVNSEKVLTAVLFLADCLKNISSRSILNYSEEDARGMFQTGNVVFMRGWPYAWSLLNAPSTAVAGKVGVMPIPPSVNGGKASGILGGWFMTLSKYSKHKDCAADLIKFLTSKSQQRLRSQYSYLPAFRSLYKDSYVLEHNPFFSYVYTSLQNAVTRPSVDFGKNYSKASTEIFNTINTILADSLELSDSSSNIKKQMNRLNKKLNAFLSKTRNQDSEPIKEKLKPVKEKFDWSKIKKFFGFKS